MEVQTYGRVEVRENAGFAGVFAATSFAAEEVVMPLAGTVRSDADRYSIQVGAARHLAPPLELDGAGSGAWRFMNHSCDPNVRIDVAARRIVTLRPVEAGDELLFDYNTTEWEMAEPFSCRCGAVRCYRDVGGFRRLSRSRQRSLLAHAAPHIQALARW